MFSTFPLFCIFVYFPAFVYSFFCISAFLATKNTRQVQKYVKNHKIWRKIEEKRMKNSEENAKTLENTKENTTNTLQI